MDSPPSRGMTRKKYVLVVNLLEKVDVKEFSKLSPHFFHHADFFEPHCFMKVNAHRIVLSDARKNGMKPRPLPLINDSFKELPADSPSAVAFPDVERDLARSVIRSAVRPAGK